MRAAKQSALRDPAAEISPFGHRSLRGRGARDARAGAEAARARATIPRRNALTHTLTPAASADNTPQRQTDPSLDSSRDSTCHRTPIEHRRQHHVMAS